MITKKSELKRAMESGCNYIVVGGELAQQIIKKKRLTKCLKMGAGIAGMLTSIAAIPCTGGASSAGVAMGFAAAVGSTALTISAKELAILCGAAVIGYAIKEKYDIEIDQKNGKVILKKQ